MRSYSRLVLVILFAVSLLVSIACGGSGSGTGGTALNFDGGYFCNYSRVINGGIFFTVTGSSVSATIDDGTTTFKGTSTVSADGAFQVFLHAAGQPDIELDADAPTTVNGHPQWTIHASVNGVGGWVVGPLTASYVGPNFNTYFSGTYTGTYDVAGANAAGQTFTMTVNANGSVTVTPTINGVPYVLTGTMNGTDSTLTLSVPGVGDAHYIAHYTNLGGTKIVRGTWDSPVPGATGGGFSGSTN